MMLKVYEVRHIPTGYRDDDRVFVVANNGTEAKAVAKREKKSKAEEWDYVHIRAKRLPEYDFMIEESLTDPTYKEPITKPTWLFDNSTNEDALDDTRRWFDSQCL